jgi:hypothetical protein
MSDARRVRIQRAYAPAMTNAQKCRVPQARKLFEYVAGMSSTFTFKPMSVEKLDLALDAMNRLYEAAREIEGVERNGA